MAFDYSGTANYHTKTIPALGSTLSYFAHFNPDALGVMRAFMGLVADEFNEHTAKTNAILDAIDAATSLASLKTTVGAIQNLPALTFNQLKTVIRNRLGS